ncbi:MAG TPA: NADH-quinone oxidoreductase subunit N [bacterium]|nr:NADH-quinone oxidoreductase subunit N [bacterium]
MQALPIEWTALLPLWIVSGGALGLLLLEVLGGEEGRKAMPLACGTLLVLSLWDILAQLTRPMAGALFQGTVVVDLYSLTLMGICTLSTLLACVFSASYLVREKAVTGEFYALLLLALAGMFTLILAADFLTFFVGIEFMSLAGYILAGYLRVKEGSTEAALKYFLLGVFASGFLLYGIAVLYGASGMTHFPDLRHFMDQGGASSPWTYLGVAFLLVGLGFKTGLVPFHGWAPDVYDGSPAPVSAFLSTGIKAAAFGAMARLFTEAFGLPGPWIGAFAVLAVLTMTWGNLGALAQSSVKRMLGFSSVAHAGYLMVGLSVAAVAPANEIERGVAFYLLAYTLMTGGAFGWLAWASGKGEKEVAFNDLRGLGFRDPILGLVMAFFMFSLAGMTPTAGFFGKYFLFKTAVDHGMTGLVILGVLNSFLSAYYYLKVVGVLYTRTGEGKEGALPVTWGLRLSLVLCGLGVLVAGLLRMPF